jgi:hypothetical protein
MYGWRHTNGECSREGYDGLTDNDGDFPLVCLSSCCSLIDGELETSDVEGSLHAEDWTFPETERGGVRIRAKLSEVKENERWSDVLDNDSTLLTPVSVRFIFLGTPNCSNLIRSGLID